MEEFLKNRNEWDLLQQLPQQQLPQQEQNQQHTPITSVVSFSHFLPRVDVLPPKERVFYPTLVKVAGTRALDTQLRLFRSTCHVFGHTHIDWNKEIDGVRYVQNAFGYPKERDGWKQKTMLKIPFQPFMVREVPFLVPEERKDNEKL